MTKFRYLNKRVIAALIAAICILFAFSGCKVEMTNDKPDQSPTADEISKETSPAREDIEKDDQAANGDEFGLHSGENQQTSDVELNEEQAKSSKPIESKGFFASKSPQPSENPFSHSSKPDVSSAPTATTKPQKTNSPEPTKAEELKCTLSINCKTILDNIERFDKNKLGILPKNGIIYSARTVSFKEGETVFDVLVRETKKNRIHMEHASNPMYNSEYIEGIANIYEKDCGEASGWMYKVNGKFPNYGCSQYKLKSGDKIEWVYTCDLGHDVGHAYK